jgi:capsular polysaccharide biosynthesis protein
MIGIRKFIAGMIFRKKSRLISLALSRPKNLLGPYEPLLVIDSHRNASLLPLLDGDGPDMQRGGCLSGDLELESARQLRARRVQYSTAAPIGQWQIKNREPATHLGGRWMFAGYLYDHFGHYIAESVPRLWPLLEKNKLAINGIIFIGHEGAQLSSMQESVIEALCGPLDCKIKICSHPMIAEELLIPSQASTLGPLSEPSDHYLGLLSNKQGIRDGIHRQMLYISRSKLSSTSRLIGEKLIESILERSGYCIFHPQDYSIKQQLDAYQSAKSLIFCEGSAIHAIELLGKLDAHCYVISRGGLRSHRIRAMKTILRKRCRALTIFTDVKRHRPLEMRVNAKGESVPAHWNSGVWFSYASLVSMLMKLDIDQSLIPSKIEYSKHLRKEVSDYLFDLNPDVYSVRSAYTARALQLFLGKIKKEIDSTTD